jgi:hypothetical protein
MTKVNLTVAQVTDRAESLYAMCYLTNSDADITIVDYLEDTETSIFLIECADALCEVRIVEDRNDDDENCESIVTVLNKREFKSREKSVIRAKDNDRDAINFLKQVLVVA